MTYMSNPSSFTNLIFKFSFIDINILLCNYSCKDNSSPKLIYLNLGKPALNLWKD